MRAEIRADGVHIFGYVNVPGRQSRPIYTKEGKAIEVIEQGAFKDAIERAPEIRMLQDHRPDRVLATTANGSLDVREDAVGLRAEAVVSDEEIMTAAKKGKIRGWSFDMRHVDSEMEARAEGELPIRHVKKLDMSEISLIIGMNPCYSSTSVEVRGEEPEDVEIRGNCEVENFEIRHIDNDTENDNKWRDEIAAAKAKINELKIGGAE